MNIWNGIDRLIWQMETWPAIVKDRRCHDEFLRFRGPLPVRRASPESHPHHGHDSTVAVSYFGFVAFNSRRVAGKLVLFCPVCIGSRVESFKPPPDHSEGHRGNISRRSMRVAAALLLALLALSSTGCTTYRQQNRIIDYWTRGDIAGAEKEAARKVASAGNGKDAVIWRLE
ncbi:MAG: hypothetical protein N3G20_07315, partial [Verrucomicrobiae bacterium]|nr:hypothetical protein [Verrucomicrobiae bacterium]